MAFEKAKVLKAAEKFLSQGNIKAAIDEYRQIVKHDEDDLTALNMLGDLYVRAGDKDAAIPCFARIAEHYREQQFSLKAIAMYKKIDRLHPRDPQVAARLASLYAAEGLVVDARAQYLVVADSYAKSGDQKRALAVLHSIADLDPQNTEIRLKLADNYAKGGLRKEAVQAFAEAGARLLESGKFENSLQAFGRALELAPFDRRVLSGLVSAHVALGTAYEATELIEGILADRPDDIELISLLLRAHLEAHDAPGAERATTMLMAQDASNYGRFLDVARLYLSSADLDSAARVLASVTERVLAGREENQLLDLVNELLTRDPEHITALRLLVRIHWWQRDMEKLRAALERLMEAAQADGLIDDERYALTQLVRLVPDEPRYADRLQALGGAQEELHDKASALIDGPGEEVPTFEGFAIVKEGAVGAEGPAAGGNSKPGPVDEFEFNAVDAQPISDPNASFADLNEDVDHGYETTSGAGSEFTMPEPDTREVDYSGAVFQSSPAPAVDTINSREEVARREAMLRQELESVDFYIAQGYIDIALDTLSMLERQFEQHPDIDARRARLSESAGTETPQHAPAEFEPIAGAEQSASEPPAEFAFEDIPEATIDAAPVVTPVAPDQPSPNAPANAFADLFEEFRVEEEAEQGSEDYETHFNMGLAYKEMGLFDEAIREFQIAAGMVKKGDGTPRFLQCCNMLAHCFMQKNLPKAAVRWLEQGLEAPGHSQDEYQALRYELGTAFEAMGQLNKSIEAFEEVYSINISYRGVDDRLRELKDRKARSEGKKVKTRK